jgi:thioredoxin reductase (NADPH)
MILQERLMADSNIEILWNRTVTAIRADENGVSEVELQEIPTGGTHMLKADGIFIFIGFNPNNKLVPAGVKYSADGYVITDEKCETQIPGIFVIGDLREKYARQIVLSAADGCMAALAASHYVRTRRP